MIHTDAGWTLGARMLENELEVTNVADIVVGTAYYNYIEPLSDETTGVKLSLSTSTYAGFRQCVCV
jgi:hypothetical protein